MIKKNQIPHVKAEKEILSITKNSWITELKAAFRDEKYLYLVMDFLQGGDLMTQLIAKDIFSEDESRFYTIQIIAAVHSVHKMKYIHRDLKPDNILIGADGHVRLSDFGLSKNINISNEAQSLFENLKNKGLFSSHMLKRDQR